MIKDEFKTQSTSYDSLEGAVVRAMAGPILTRIPRGVSEVRGHIERRVAGLIERYPDRADFLNEVMSEILR